jgi:tRNA uracil 4-sulfurtransferase
MKRFDVSSRSSPIYGWCINKMSMQYSTPIPADTDLVILRVGELWLKGRNQQRFIDRLKHNLRTTIRAAAGPCVIRGNRGHLFLHLEEPAKLKQAIAVAADTPGITSVSPVYRLPSDLDAIEAKCVELATKAWGGRDISFAAKTKRLDKSLPFNAPELNQRFGGAVFEQVKLRVDLKNPDEVLGIEVGKEHSHIWVQTYRAVGGLPIGCTGKVLLLLSGGIDSPVAGYMAQKRGCELEAIYFHSPPFISEASREKVEALARKLAPRQGGMTLKVVPFTEIQKAIKANCDGRLAVLLYRRFMYRIADRVAVSAKAHALCTGENLAQVASQTLENLNLVDQVTSRITLRPLITYDKAEIVNISRRIGTFETSILPHDDCCTLFVPKHPVTKGRLSILESAEAKLPVEDLINAAIDGIEDVSL